MAVPSQSSLPQPRDAALDGLRGVAILLVYLFHYGGGLRSGNPLVRALGYLSQAGWIGVEIFFVLSGFLITRLLADDLYTAHGLRTFYARRALRILPLYIAALLACAACALLSGASFSALKPLLVYAGFLQNVPPLVNTALHTPPPLPIYHLWSLAIEEQFYLLWPFLLLAVPTPRRALHLCLWVFVLSCAFRIVLFAPHLPSAATLQRFTICLPTRAGALALGGALAFYRRPTERAVILGEAQKSRRTPEIPGGGPRQESFKDKSALTASLALALILLTFAHTGTLLLGNRLSLLAVLPAVDLLAVALVALSLQPGLVTRWLSTPALGFLGRISYGFYVLHILLEPLFDYIGGLLTHTSSGFVYQTARLVTAFPVTVLAAWLSFVVLEQPFLRLKRHFPRRGTASSMPQTA